MMGILKYFNLQQKKRNDDLIVTKMKTLCIRKHQKRNKRLMVTKRKSLCHRKNACIKQIIPCSFVVLFMCTLCYNKYEKKYTSDVLFYAFLLYPHCTPPVPPLYPNCTCPVPPLNPYCTLIVYSLYPLCK